MQSDDPIRIRGCGSIRPDDPKPSDPPGPQVATHSARCWPTVYRRNFGRVQDYLGQLTVFVLTVLIFRTPSREFIELRCVDTCGAEIRGLCHCLDHER